MSQVSNVLSPDDDPARILGVAATASDEEVRAAYLRKVKEFPPDRAPAEFERVRDAYGMLRDPRRRAERMLLAADPHAPLVSLLDARTPELQFVGPKPWLDALREK